VTERHRLTFPLGRSVASHAHFTAGQFVYLLSGVKGPLGISGRVNLTIPRHGAFCVVRSWKRRRSGALALSVMTMPDPASKTHSEKAHYPCSRFPETVCRACRGNLAVLHRRGLLCSIDRWCFRHGLRCADQHASGQRHGACAPRAHQPVCIWSKPSPQRPRASATSSIAMWTGACFYGSPSPASLAGVTGAYILSNIDGNIAKPFVMAESDHDRPLSAVAGVAHEPWP